MAPGENPKVTTATRAAHHVLITKPNERQRDLLTEPYPAIRTQIDARAAFWAVGLQPHASIELPVALGSQVRELRLKVRDLGDGIAQTSLRCGHQVAGGL